MDATECIAALMKAVHEREIRELLDFAEFLLAKCDRGKTEALDTLDNCAGRHDRGKRQREELHEQYAPHRLTALALH